MVLFRRAEAYLLSKGRDHAGKRGNAGTLILPPSGTGGAGNSLCVRTSGVSRGALLTCPSRVLHGYMVK